ncbi:hypothetical protein BJ138DRAFT_1171301 [Hygrophoropsis aurantiaca]|uniref:Uncharacterized protein n=1 Tax=Hygrophoropsis aurantiaca TaxID=72124 RepID=A0ACB8AJR0_9AGAM|nr:hypothetical protein BJ138DRAFT_1171301 [Hygrophoropsis aurantiaca]
MGGRAFLQILPKASFPRLPTFLYQKIKLRLKARLQTLYTIVEIPAEAPEKVDHGDLDFVVARPVNSRNIVTHDQVREVLGATEVIGLDRTSNYAVLIDNEEWRDYQRTDDGNQIYFQVDVNVCTNEEEVQSILMFHGFGDLGIIIGTIASGCGLSIGTKGMKISNPSPDPPIHLTSSPVAIFHFLGLSTDTWKRGFSTQEAVFKFAASSRFFDPQKLVPRNASKKKAAESRTMYRNFLVWAQEQNPGVDAICQSQDMVEEALVQFGKKDERDLLVRQRYEKEWMKHNFNGKLVAEWTGLGWKGVKVVMDAVRIKVGGESMLIGRRTAELKDLVGQAKDELQLN